jgi:hypothetical protein
MKKIVSLLFGVLLLLGVVFLNSCEESDSGDSIVGTWKLSESYEDGVLVDPNAIYINYAMYWLFTDTTISLYRYDTVLEKLFQCEGSITYTYDGTYLTGNGKVDKTNVIKVKDDTLTISNTSEGVEYIDIFDRADASELDGVTTTSCSK